MILSDVLDFYRNFIPKVIHRVPNSDDTLRWRTHTIEDREYRIVQPVTFTPYASVKSCSARCRFCSENLREKLSARHSSLLRPSSDYFSQLDLALKQLQGLPLSYSLSGLEMTDDRQWFLSVMDVLSSHANTHTVEGKVLYTNGSGLLSLGRDAPLMEAMQAFGFSWLELSRHHFDSEQNQHLMRFRSESGVACNQRFSDAVAVLKNVSELKFVCIVQSGGVDSLSSLLKYLDWARQLGVKHIIFRELSLLDDGYEANNTYKYIASSRVSVGKLLSEFLEMLLPDNRVAVRQSTQGYYFSNLAVDYDGLNVTFESSSYIDLRVKHDSGKVYKLVFHANGNLCADWDPDKHVLFSAHQEA